MQKKREFYNEYHKKNKKFFSIISDNNFTYFYIQKLIAKIYEGSGSHPKVLDVGCGVGTLSLYLAKKGAEVDGYDISTRSISLAKDYASYANMKNVIFRTGDVQKIRIEKKYDIIICTEVIEHLENDNEMIKKMGNLLKRNGYLILSTPSVNAPLFRMGLLDSFDKEVGHLRRYSSTTLAMLLRRSNLEAVELRRIEGLPRNFLFTVRPFGELIRLIKGPLIPIFHFIDEIFVFLLGESNLIVLAQKKNP